MLQREHASRCTVEQHDLAPTACNHDRLGHAAQNRFEFVTLVGKGLDFQDNRIGGIEEPVLGARDRVTILPHQVGWRLSGFEGLRDRIYPFGASLQVTNDGRRRDGANREPSARNCDNQPDRDGAHRGQHRKQEHPGEKTRNYRKNYTQPVRVSQAPPG